jgi:LmbE family N-acetylglucosaminyl deacetylase
LKVLWVGAHPDDLEILAGGTLAKYVMRGHEAYSCVVAKGDKGAIEVDPEKLAKTRIREAKKGCEILGAEFVGNLGWPDFRIFVNEKLIDTILEVVRRVKPDLVITHSPNDYQNDHICTSIATVAAVFNSANPAFVSKHPAHRVARTLYCDTIFGLDFEPDFWVDISETIDIKLKALSAHKSQLSFLTKAQRFQDTVEDVKVCARYRGLQAGVLYAETFKLVKRSMHNLAFDLSPLD